MKFAAPLLVLAVALAGCQTTSPAHPVDGDAVLDLVESIVYLDDGSLRVRSPGTSGHLDTAAWLRDQLAPWDARLNRFNGSDYLALDKGVAGTWADSDRYCSQEDRNQLPGLEFANVFATKPGAADGHVVLAAHWDAKEDTQHGDGPVPAANDGASGVALLLELQDHIDRHGLEFPFDLTIALFDGEDGFEDCHPLAGSLWASRTEQLGAVSQLILFDMVGDADARFLRETFSTDSAPDVVDLIWSKAPAHGLATQFTDKVGRITDDHVPFVEDGVRAVDIIDAGRDRTFPPYWHTAEDTPDKLSADMLGAMGDLMLDVLTDPAFERLLE